MKMLLPIAALMVAVPALGHDRAPGTEAPCAAAPRPSRHQPVAWPIDPGGNTIPGTGDYIAPPLRPGTRPIEPWASGLNSMGQGAMTPPLSAPSD